MPPYSPFCSFDVNKRPFLGLLIIIFLFEYAFSETTFPALLLLPFSSFPFSHISFFSCLSLFYVFFPLFSFLYGLFVLDPFLFILILFSSSLLFTWSFNCLFNRDIDSNEYLCLITLVIFITSSSTLVQAATVYHCFFKRGNRSWFIH